MKIKFIIIYLFLFMLAIQALADDASVLRTRLNKINSFYTQFTQIITDVNGIDKQKSKGELWIKKPNKFNLHIINPNESILISNGKTFWFYNSLTEQLTVNWLKNIDKNSIIMLLINNNLIDWYQYKIKKVENSFSLVPISENDNLKYLTIQINNDGIIKSFIYIEKDGQCNSYYFNNYKSYFIDNSTFEFKMPNNITIDDQRN